MATYSTNEFRSGLKIIIDGDPCTMLENHVVKPGKGQAFNRIKYRNLKTGRVIERTFKSGDTVEPADVLETELQFLYSDGQAWHFMEPDSYEQHAAGAEVLGEAAQWLKEQDMCMATFWNRELLSVTPPNFVALKVSETEPGVRGDTASGATKPATLETGAVVKVPLFVDVGDTIKVDTRSGEYVARAKE